MKRTISICLSLLLSLALLAGCKKDAATTAPTTVAGVPGASQTAGRLTVFVPEGWTLVPDELKEDQVYVSRNGSDVSTSTYVKLTLDSALPPENLCTNVQTIAPQTYGTLTWSGFSGAKTNGEVIYLTTTTNGSNLLATLWYTEGAEPLTLEDPVVQAILGNITITEKAAPAEPEAPETLSVAGDWSGTMEIISASGDLAEKEGLTCKAIARILVNGNNMTPYIGLAEEGGSITNLVHTPATENAGANTSGVWNGIPFDNAEIVVDGDRLSIQISAVTETGSAFLQMSMEPATDFETQAEQLGCTGYPSK